MMMLASTTIVNLLILASSSFVSPISFDPPPALRASLIEASEALEVAGTCAETLGLETEYESRDERFWRAKIEAASIWGGDIDLANNSTADVPTVGCDARQMQVALASIDAALDLEARLFRQATAEMDHGLWIGPLKLCRATVTKINPGID